MLVGHRSSSSPWKWLTRCMNACTNPQSPKVLSQVLENSLPAFQARAHEVGAASSSCLFSRQFYLPTVTATFTRRVTPTRATITLTSSTILKTIGIICTFTTDIADGKWCQKPESPQPLSLRRLRLIVHLFLSCYKARGLTLHMNAFCAATITTTVTAIAHCCKFQSDWVGFQDESW